MSYHAMAWAGQQRPQTAMQKLVLFQLAWHVNQTTGVCNPSLDTLAEETSLCRTAVKSAISGLVKQGFIMKFSGSSKGCRVSNSYSMNRSDNDPLIGRQTTVNRSFNDRGIGRQTPPNMYIEQGKEQELKKDMSYVHVRHVGTDVPELPPRVDSPAKREALRKLSEMKLSGPLARALQVVK